MNLELNKQISKLKLKVIKALFHKELDTIYNIEEVSSFFFLLTESFFDLSRIQLALQPDLKINIQQKGQLLKALEALKTEMPIQYIIGETEFYGLPFMVNEKVLIPRPETEELVDWIVSEFKNLNSEFRILDFGTGSGCIAIALAKNLPNASIFALDVSKEALEIAKYNAKQNNVKVTFIEADILKLEARSLKLEDQFFLFEKDVAKRKKGLFDVIVSNPPYVRALEKEKMNANVLKYEPHLALFVEDKDPLLFYRKITQLASEILRLKGEVFFEINEYLGNDMVKLLNDDGFVEIALKTDIFGKDRMIKAIKL